MKLFKLFLFTLFCSVNSLAHAMDGGGAGMVGDILLVILGVMGVHIVSFILFIILFKKMTRAFDKKSPMVLPHNSSMPSIRDVIRQQRTTKIKLLCFGINLLSFLISLGLYYIVFLTLKIHDFKLYFSQDLQFFIFYGFPSIMLFSFLCMHFFVLMNQYYTRKIIHHIDFKAFKKLQKENGQFIMPENSHKND